MEKKDSFVEALSAILVKQNAITPEKAEGFKKAFHDSPKTEFDEFLLEEGFVDRSDLLNALSEYYQVPAFDVVGYFFDHELLKQFPQDFLLRNTIIPLKVEDPTLIVIASNPADEELLPKIGRYVSYDLTFNVGLAQDIRDAINEFSELALTQATEVDDVYATSKEERDASEQTFLDIEDITKLND